MTHDTPKNEVSAVQATELEQYIWRGIDPAHHGCPKGTTPTTKPVMPGTASVAMTAISVSHAPATSIAVPSSDRTRDRSQQTASKSYRNYNHIRVRSLDPTGPPIANQGANPALPAPGGARTGKKYEGGSLSPNAATIACLAPHLLSLCKLMIKPAHSARAKLYRARDTTSSDVTFPGCDADAEERRSLPLTKDLLCGRRVGTIGFGNLRFHWRPPLMARYRP